MSDKKTGLMAATPKAATKAEIESFKSKPTPRAVKGKDVTLVSFRFKNADNNLLVDLANHFAAGNKTKTVLAAIRAFNELSTDKKMGYIAKESTG